MHAKIILLRGDEKEKKSVQMAGEILTDISAAFNHVFSIIEKKIGSDSEAVCGTRITEKTADAVYDCDGALILSADEKDMQELCDAISLPVRIQSFCVPAALCGKHDQPVSLWIAQALSNDEETIESAAKTVFSFAEGRDAKVYCVIPNGASRSIWEKSITNAQKEYEDVTSASALPADAIKKIILSPADCGIIFCAPYAGNFFNAAAEALCPYPGMIHEVSFDDQCGIYAVGLKNETRFTNPFSLALAVADLLRYSLKLENEASCIEAAVNNVFSSGWRSKDLSPEEYVDADKIISLICEQISVAGELMNKGVFIK